MYKFGEACINLEFKRYPKRKTEYRWIDDHSRNIPIAKKEFNATAIIQ